MMSTFTQHAKRAHSCAGIVKAELQPRLYSPARLALTRPVTQTQVLQGLLWVFPIADDTEASSKSPALIAELDDASFVDATDFFVRDMPYSWEVRAAACVVARSRRAARGQCIRTPPDSHPNLSALRTSACRGTDPRRESL